MAYTHGSTMNHTPSNTTSAATHTTRVDEEYSIVVIDFIDPHTPNESFMINASVRITKHLTQQMHDTGWLLLHNGTDTRCVNASLIKGIALRVITND